jgi:cell shape-determining protein MreD
MFVLILKVREILGVILNHAPWFIAENLIIPLFLCLMLLLSPHFYALQAD